MFELLILDTYKFTCTAYMGHVAEAEGGKSCVRVLFGGRAELRKDKPVVILSSLQ